MEDVAGRAKTCLIIDRVDNKTGVRVVRGQNILNLLNKEIFLFETIIKFSGVSYRHFVAGMIYEAELHLFMVNFDTDWLLSVLLIWPAPAVVKIFHYKPCNSPRELSKVWICSEVRKRDTREVFPTWQSPIMQTRSFLPSSRLPSPPSPPPPPLSLGELMLEEQAGDLEQEQLYFKLVFIKCWELTWGRRRHCCHGWRCKSWAGTCGSPGTLPGWWLSPSWWRKTSVCSTPGSSSGWSRGWVGCTGENLKQQTDTSQSETESRVDLEAPGSLMFSSSSCTDQPSSSSSDKPGSAFFCVLHLHSDFTLLYWTSTYLARPYQTPSSERAGWKIMKIFW